MNNPRREAWLYVVVGVIAVLGAGYFLAVDGMGSGSFGILDWAILGMGIVAVYRGIKGFSAIKRDSVAPPEPGASTTFRRRSTKNDSGT